MINLLIFGPSGEMGGLISKLALKDPDLNIIAALDVKKIGGNLSQVVGSSTDTDLKICDVNDLEDIIKKGNIDIMVDFTTASATEKNAIICVKNRIKCVIGTTGMSDEFYEKFNSITQKYKIPAVISPNMSTGINVLFKIIENLSKYIQDWDIEIIEKHHHRKKDVPSGTALKLAEIISNSLDVNLDEVAKYGRDKGINKRKIGSKNEIGMHSVRGGDIVGDHTILFAGIGERIEVKHQAQSRLCFAEGAIKAIKFIANTNNCKIFTTTEVLNL